MRAVSGSAYGEALFLRRSPSSGPPREVDRTGSAYGEALFLRREREILRPPDSLDAGSAYGEALFLRQRDDRTDRGRSSAGSAYGEALFLRPRVRPRALYASEGWQCLRRGVVSSAASSLSGVSAATIAGSAYGEALFLRHELLGEGSFGQVLAVPTERLLFSGGTGWTRSKTSLLTIRVSSAISRMSPMKPVILPSQERLPTSLSWRIPTLVTGGDQTRNYVRGPFAKPEHKT